MKDTFLLISVLLFLNLAYAQPHDKEYFSKRSRHQKSTAWILLSAGTASIITGVITDHAHKGEEKSFTGGFFEICGIFASAISIPYFVSSSRNKHRAMALSFNNRKILLPQNNSLTFRSHPSVSLIMQLKAP